MSITVYSPNRQKKIVESKPAPSKVEHGKTATIGITGSTFPVPTIGTYTVELKLGEEVHDFNFAIEAGPNFVPDKKVIGTSAKKRSVKSPSRQSRR